MGWCQEMLVESKVCLSNVLWGFGEGGEGGRGAGGLAVFSFWFMASG